MSDFTQIFLTYILFGYVVIVGGLLYATLKEAEGLLQKVVAVFILLLAPYLLVVGIIFKDMLGDEHDQRRIRVVDTVLPCHRRTTVDVVANLANLDEL